MRHPRKIFEVFPLKKKCSTQILLINNVTCVRNALRHHRNSLIGWHRVMFMENDIHKQLQHSALHNHASERRKNFSFRFYEEINHNFPSHPLLLSAKELHNGVLKRFGKQQRQLEFPLPTRESMEKCFSFHPLLPLYLLSSREHWKRN